MSPEAAFEYLHCRPFYTKAVHDQTVAETHYIENAIGRPVTRQELEHIAFTVKACSPAVRRIRLKWVKGPGLAHLAECRRDPANTDPVADDPVRVLFWLDAEVLYEQSSEYRAFFSPAHQARHKTLRDSYRNP